MSNLETIETQPYNFESEFDQLMASRVSGNRDTGNRFSAFIEDKVKNPLMNQLKSYLDLYTSGMFKKSDLERKLGRPFEQFIKEKLELVLSILQSIPQEILDEMSLSKRDEVLTRLNSIYSEVKDTEAIGEETAHNYSNELVQIYETIKQIDSEYRGNT